MKFHHYLAVLFAILQISGVKSTDEEVICGMGFGGFGYERIYEILGKYVSGQNYTTIVDYIESNKNTATYYRGKSCHSCGTNITISGDCDYIIQVIGICTEESSVPADCVAVALYNLTECKSASWCSLWEEGSSYSGYRTMGSFSADCSGISSKYPSCAVTCEDNVTTAEACIGDITTTTPPTTAAPEEAPRVDSGSSHMTKVAIMVSVAGAAWLALFGT